MHALTLSSNPASDQASDSEDMSAVYKSRNQNANTAYKLCGTAGLSTLFYLGFWQSTNVEFTVILQEKHNEKLS